MKQGREESESTIFGAETIYLREAQRHKGEKNVRRETTITRES